MRLYICRRSQDNWLDAASSHPTIAIIVKLNPKSTGNTVTARGIKNFKVLKSTLWQRVMVTPTAMQSPPPNKRHKILRWPRTQDIIFEFLQLDEGFIQKNGFSPSFYRCFLGNCNHLRSDNFSITGFYFICIAAFQRIFRFIRQLSLGVFTTCQLNLQTAAGLFGISYKPFVLIKKSSEYLPQ